ncbi:insulinase family protein [Marinobacterium arenosum]|uniref:insulinase family protein n=1 Tax=Marinobacterium arenosum TaxID=2862496 RepID=UPI001C964C3A|nr:insulinase family protein [Marinobacterium arenosum]MBY4677967.1 insulinase family protein [Marinobacterium arenosum]
MQRTRRPSLLRYLAISLLLILSKLAHAGIHKSPNDHRSYLGFTLPNHMKVLVISDPDSHKAAASLDVDVGSNANPHDRPGLAHFLEHMLFLGTEKFPEAGEYQSFISSHGGSHNAYTAYGNTNYYFDINADDLDKALDRFSQFFISPLFAAEYVDRERHAVHSEFQSKMRDDGRRLHEAAKQALNPAHSYSRFSVGSLQSLADHGDDRVRDDLIKFYDQYYSANLMTLVVQGRQPVEELKEMVEKRFSAVPNKQAERYQDASPLFTADQLPAQLNVRSIKERRTLSLTFPVASIRDHWREKPLHFLASQIGYEGKGSLLAELKARGWATGLAAYTGTDLPGNATFKVKMALTPEGMKHYQQISGLFFDYLQLLDREGINTALYDEERRMNQIQFQFSEKQEAIDYVGRLATQLQRYPAEQVIQAPYLMEKFDANLIRGYLQQMRPDNMLLTLVSNDQATDRQSPNFKAPFSLKKLDDAALAALKSSHLEHQLAVRSTNPYLAEDLALKPIEEATEQPEVILQQVGMTLWHQQDAEFRTPKSDFYFSVMSERANGNARDAVLTALYTRMVEDQLNGTLYDAAMAGLNTRIYPHLSGVSVRISGFDDKQDLLLKQVVTALNKPQLAQERFAIVKQQYAESLANSQKEKPFNQTTKEIMQLLLPEWTVEQKLEALNDLQLSDLQAFIPQLLAKTELRLLAHGNLQQKDAVGLAMTVKNELHRGREQTALAPPPVLQLPKERHLVQTLEVEHNDSAISVYFQGEDTELKTRAQFALLSELMASPFYTRLRTEQQLGYVVFQTPIQLRKAPGLAFVVQSPVADPLQLETHIDQFMGEMRDSLLTMNEAELERYKRSLISRIMKPENSLAERSDRYWREIDRQADDFNSREQLVQAVNDLKIEDLVNCYQGMSERRLTVRSFGQKHLQKVASREVAKKCDTEIDALKARQSFMPGA